MEYQDLTEKIIGCAFRAYNQMGFGFLESVYEKCMRLELRAAGLTTCSQVPITVKYAGKPVGEFCADLLVEGAVVVELKSQRALASANEVQLVNYLVATGKPVGLLINFGESQVEVRRKVRTLPRSKEPAFPAVTNEPETR